MYRCFWGFFITFLFYSCSSLKELHSFAESSANGIDKFDAIDYTFTSTCRTKCVNRASLESSFTNVLNCDCQEAILADKSLKKVLTALKTYFKQLGQVSNNKLSEVSLAAIEQPLVANKYFKKSTLKPYATIIEHITAAAKNNYRIKMLRKHLKSTHPAVDTLLHVSAGVITNNLIPTTVSSRMELVQIYHDLHADKSNSAYDRFRIQQLFYKEQALLSEQEERLKGYVKALGRIQQGYGELNRNSNRLKKQEIRKLIASYSEALDAIFSNL